MPTTCDITFDHSDGNYKSGETINGHVKLHTEKPKNIRGIYIKVDGHARVKWEERRSRQRNGKTEYYTVYYEAYEQYLNSKTYVAGRDCGDSFDLPPGIYDYSFSCALPVELPSSCRETYGKIKYEVTVTIDRKLRLDNEFTKPFHVDHIIDLNLNMQNKLPMSNTDSTAACCLTCCCGADNEIKAELKIPFGATVSGSTVPFELLIINDSSTDIRDCKVKLKKVVTFKSVTPSSKTKDITADIDTKLYDTILRLTRKEFKGFLTVPIGMTCTQIGGCISIQYYIKAKVYMGCCASNINIQLPFVIGTIPFIQQTNAFNDSTVITSQPTAPPSYMSPPSYSSEEDKSGLILNSLDLPTYEDTVKDHSDDEIYKNKNKYKPLPTYSENHFEFPSAPQNNTSGDNYTTSGNRNDNNNTSSNSTFNTNNGSFAVATASSSTSTTVTVPFGWKST